MIANRGRRGVRGAEPEAGTVGHRIWKARQDMNLTQENLAMDAGVDRGVIAYLERNIYNSSRWENIVKIAQGLDVSLNYLAGNQKHYGKFGS